MNVNLNSCCVCVCVRTVNLNLKLSGEAYALMRVLVTESEWWGMNVWKELV